MNAHHRSASTSSSSSNPFRRRGPSAPSLQTTMAPTAVSSPFPADSLSSATPTPPPSAADFFRQRLESLPRSAGPPPVASFSKPKPVKKVRVQSPPPESPESPDPLHHPASFQLDAADFEARFPVDGAPSVPDTTRLPTAASYSSSDSTSGSEHGSPLGRPPPNPFPNTLGDLEQTSSNDPNDPSPAPKGSLDVDAFRRLLMTGTSVDQQPRSASQTYPHPSSHQTDTASFTDASSVSRQSIFDASNAAETPRTSHEISEYEIDDQHHLLVSAPSSQSQATHLRKKPPPPASRRGKSIRLQLDREAPEPLASPSASSDLNKPLPTVPADEPRDSVFDREAAGKTPEVDIDPDAPDDRIPPPRPPTPPNSSHVVTPEHAPSTEALASPTASRKPAPPPRRQAHGRSDSRATITSVSSLASPTGHLPPAPFSRDDDGEMRGSRRPSSESMRSRSSSIRAPAPAPPPPRRPTFGSSTVRQAPPTTSPSATREVVAPTPTSPGSTPALEDEQGWPREGSAADTSLSSSSSTPRLQALSAPPPPPPARHSSVRSARPASIRSVDSSSRRIDPKDGMATASSVGAPPPPPPRPRVRGLSRADSIASTDISGSKVQVVPEETSEEILEGAGKDILADLDALQREVDALRGHMAG